MKKRSIVTVSLSLVVLMSGAAFAAPFALAPVDPAFERWSLEKTLDPGENATGYVPSPVRFHHTPQPSLKGTLPVRFDLRDLNALTAVKHQWQCGACWSFAACGVLEANLRRATGAVWDFSENHMKNTHGFLLGPCMGGNNYISMAYLSRWTGPLLESDDPYNPSTIVPPLEGAVRQKLLLRGVHFTLDESGAERIKNYIYETGALSATMMWRDADYNSVSRSYYYSGGQGATGHMVMLVGWDDQMVIPGAPGAGAWICKNSWGHYWGDQGFFYISYYDTAFLDDAAGFDTLANPNAYGTLYYYDPFGLTGFAGSGAQLDVYGANVFHAVQEESIVAVGTYAVSDNLSYTVSVIRGGVVNGVPGAPAVSVSGVFETAGYYVVPLPASVELAENETFTVLVRYNSPDFDFPMPLERPIAQFCAATAAPGQSYISEDGLVFTDLPGMGAGWANSNVCIKAVAAYKEQEVPVPSVHIVGRPKVETGQLAVLHAVTAHLTEPMTFFWYKDGVLLPGAEFRDYTIPSVSAADSGSYVVQVSDDSQGVFNSPPFVLEVLEEGSLPVAGAPALLLLVLLLTLAGAFLFLNRLSSIK